MILLDDFVGESLSHELDPFVSASFDGPIDMLSDDSGESDEVFLNNLWVDTKPSSSIFDDFPHETSALKPIKAISAIKREMHDPPRASFASFAKVKKEQAKHAKREVAVSSIRRDVVKNTARRTKRKSTMCYPASIAGSVNNPGSQMPRAPRGRRKSTSDDVDSKLREMEEQLKNLDPNSKEAKKQRRLIRNRMSAQLHRERKKMYVDQLEGELYHRDLEITRLKDELEHAKQDNLRLKSELSSSRAAAVSSSDLLSPEVLDKCLFDALNVPSSPELLTDAECDGEMTSGNTTPRSSLSGSSDTNILPSKNITMLLAVVFSVAFFGNGTTLLDELANGRDLSNYFKTKDLPQIQTMHTTLTCLDGTVWEAQEELSTVSTDMKELHRPSKRMCMEDQRTNSNPIHVVYGEDADELYGDDDLYGAHQYSAGMLKSCESLLNHRLKQSPDVFQKVALELKQIVGKKVSYLKFLFPTSAGTYEQVQCQVAAE